MGQLVGCSHELSPEYSSCTPSSAVQSSRVKWIRCVFSCKTSEFTFYAAAVCELDWMCTCAAMSDEPHRLPSLSDLLRQSEVEDQEERAMAQLSASAALEHAKKCILLQALIAEAAWPLRSWQTPPRDAQDPNNYVESLSISAGQLIRRLIFINAL